MSASSNTESLMGQGKFHDRIPPSQPMTTKGHQPGQKVGNDRYAEFHAETYPPGSAPSKDTFRPNPESEVPGQANNPDMDPSLRTGALDQPGATSASVYDNTNFEEEPHHGGGPVLGTTNRELHGAHDGTKRKRQGHGLEGVGAPVSNAAAPEGSVTGKAHDQGLDLEGNGPQAHRRGVRGATYPDDLPSAVDQQPVGAGELASQRPGGRR
ncbi:hypothetical protein SPI_05208 [Niveomyces insectorum RCEF 264]|uniref:Uncharacterized protein n=1 Tax=Niveomyces insectorum RCEF 264 TaxID=1081102 RepID=A0A167U2P0_9HYPO|nr:hypothetical protein SPI_05208 [Niveomyces insectorum RCEF 264]